jgi:outer membrane protein assembly factor BamE
MRPRFSVSKSMQRRLTHSLVAISAALCVSTVLSGCVYRMNIQQGNFLEPRAVSQLQVGMTRSQVRYLLGTPMVPDAFDKDRWDYLYYLKQGRLRAPEQRHLIVFFEEDKVSKFDNSGAGPMPPAEQREIEPDSKNAKANASS